MTSYMCWGPIGSLMNMSQRASKLSFRAHTCTHTHMCTHISFTEATLSTHFDAPLMRCNAHCIHGVCMQVYVRVWYCCVTHWPIDPCRLLSATFKKSAGFQQKVGHIETDLDFMVQKVAYVAINLLSLFMAAYKLSSLGLLPTTDSDWLEFMEQGEVRIRGGAKVCMRV